MAGNYTLTAEEGSEENEAFFEEANWRKFRGPGRDTGLNRLLRQYETPRFAQLSRELESWCGMVMGENEEELFDAIKEQRYTERGGLKRVVLPGHEILQGPAAAAAPGRGRIRGRERALREDRVNGGSEPLPAHPTRPPAAAAGPAHIFYSCLIH